MNFKQKYFKEKILDYLKLDKKRNKNDNLIKFIKKFKFFDNAKIIKDSKESLLFLYIQGELFCLSTWDEDKAFWTACVYDEDRYKKIIPIATFEFDKWE